jgi:hypothetical protein
MKINGDGDAQPRMAILLEKRQKAILIRSIVRLMHVVTDGRVIYFKKMVTK